jgi:hypothetical protein
MPLSDDLETSFARSLASFGVDEAQLHDAASSVDPAEVVALIGTACGASVVATGQRSRQFVAVRGGRCSPLTWPFACRRTTTDTP